MIYREYGKTGKMVSAVGFGGMRFKKEEYENGNFEKSSAIVKRAFELGINYFDTAPGYCDDKSEAIFGNAFKDMKGEFYVSTKCGLWNAKNSDEARARIEKSLKTLNVQKINFYNMWCIKTFDEYKEFLKKGGVYEGALKAQSEGLIDHISFTTHMSGEDIAKIANDGIFSGVTLGYNAMNFAYRQKGVDACHKAGLAVITMNPLGGGMIPTHEEYFSFIKENETQSISVAALRFLLSQKEITVALPGISSIEELEENITVADNITIADEKHLDKMKQNLNSYLNEMCTGCSYCDECPVGIEIPKLLASYNEYFFSNHDEKAVISKLHNHWDISGEDAKKCIACGKCEQLCTQKLPIIERLGKISGWL